MERLEADLVDLTRGLHAGEIRPSRLVEHAIERHETSGLGLNAYVVWDPERARARARDLRSPVGPLWGVPVSVKDLFGVPGWPIHAGMRRPLPDAWQAAGPIVSSLRRQGAILVGKTHTVELAFGGLGTNPHWPVPRNPWDAARHRVPGGSSAGAGVSLAEGSARVALGTDTAGSVRVPASFTGQVGVKTSPSRWSTAGVVPLSSTLDTVGLLARSARDARSAFAALDGEPPGEPAAPPELGGVRIGRLEGLAWDDLDPGIGEAVERALAELDRAGARVERLRLPAAREALDLFSEGGPVAAELAAFLEQELPGRRAELDPNVEARIVAADQLTAVEYLGRLRRLARLRDAAAREAGDVDVVATPTAAITPPPVEEVAEPRTYARKNVLSLRNTSVFSYMGWCAVSLPVGLDREGMPVGMQLACRGGEDRRLMEIAVAIERAIGDPASRLGFPPGLGAGEPGAP
jgi:aspartyl-tRNA(Asn)/glutamyl-tRNA(Gln) amidotransferase subunit A